MRPKELHRDTNGLTRLDSIEHADRLVAEAREMAADWTADPERGFSHYGDDDCDICDSAHTCGRRWYEDLLIDAQEIYRERGLGMLADRVDAIRYLPPNKAWAEFDETNAATEV